MQAKLIIAGILIVVLTITTIKLNNSNQKLYDTISHMYGDLEENDESRAAAMGDYQIDIVRDTIWLRDDDRLVSTFIIPKHPKDSIVNSIINDNQ